MSSESGNNCCVSIIISSFNYDRYLGNSIDSALGQSHDSKEVIVVDDGSTDSSKKIIKSYGNRIVPVLKTNGGQASALNAGISISTGEVIFFLDSDDILLPSAVEIVVGFFEDTEIAKVHWPLLVIDESGRQQERIMPDSPLDEGELLDAVVHGGPGGYSWPPTTGNAWSRGFIDDVFPIPEQDYMLCPDLYLSALAPLYGRIHKVDEPQGLWRIHGQNASWVQPLDKRVRYQAQLWDRCFLSMESYGRKKGVKIDPQRLRENSWWHKIEYTINELVRLIAPGGQLVLVDEDQWGPGVDIAGRQRIHFPEKNGRYCGLPLNSAQAIEEIERLRRAGAELIAIVWTSFWWLEHYEEFYRHLRNSYPCLIDNERVIVFEL